MSIDRGGVAPNGDGWFVLWRVDPRGSTVSRLQDSVTELAESFDEFVAERL